MKLTSPHKKAVSLIVSYVLLVVIAIAISILVYSFLKLQLPFDKQECSPDIKLTVQSALCINEYLVVNLTNNGLFNVTAVFIRFAPENAKVKTQINKGKEILAPPDEKPIAPDETWHSLYNIESMGTISGNNYTLEVQPAIFSKGALIPCPNSISTHKVTCIQT